MDEWLEELLVFPNLKRQTPVGSALGIVVRCRICWGAESAGARSSIHWRYHKYMCNELLGLPETAETWSRILDNRDVIKICLPELKAVGMTPGKIFSYAEMMVETVPCHRICCGLWSSLNP